jgi:hypothetical protein
MCFFSDVQAETMQSITISDFCVSNHNIYIIYDDYTLYKSNQNELINKTPISQKISKRTEIGLINLPNISCYANHLYVHDSVNKVKVYNRDFKFIKTLPIVPLEGLIYIENDKLIYSIYVNGIVKIYYYDLITNQNVFISDANHEQDIDYRFLSQAVFFHDKYYLYLMSIANPTDYKIFVFDSQFNRVKGDKSILDIFSDENNKLIIKNNTVIYDKSIMDWNEKKQARIFKTIFYSYDIKNRKNTEMIKLDNVIVKDFFLEDNMLYYLSSIDGRIYRKLF